MDLDTSFVGTTFLIGAGATLVMDAWALILKLGFKVPTANYCFVGRWLSHMPAGKFRHSSIATAESMPAECATGWVFHYLVGIAYAFLLVLLTGAGWIDHPTLLPALLLGVGTVLVPYLLMQPAFGLGIAASKTPNPNQARLKSLMAHSVFGIGLYVSAAVMRDAAGM